MKQKCPGSLTRPEGTRVSYSNKSAHKCGTCGAWIRRPLVDYTLLPTHMREVES
jgi:hypothetical protein